MADDDLLESPEEDMQDNRQFTAYAPIQYRLAATNQSEIRIIGPQYNILMTSDRITFSNDTQETYVAQLVAGMMLDEEAREVGLRNAVVIALPNGGTIRLATVEDEVRVVADEKIESLLTAGGLEKPKPYQPRRIWRSDILEKIPGAAPIGLIMCENYAQSILKGRRVYLADDYYKILVTPEQITFFEDKHNGNFILQTINGILLDPTTRREAVERDLKFVLPNGPEIFAKEILGQMLQTIDHLVKNIQPPEEV